MKIDPDMYMKTLGKRQNVYPYFQLFAQKPTDYMEIDNIGAGLLAENAKMIRYSEAKWHGIIQPNRKGIMPVTNRKSQV